MYLNFHVNILLYNINYLVACFDWDHACYMKNFIYFQTKIGIQTLVIQLPMIRISMGLKLQLFSFLENAFFAK